MKTNSKFKLNIWI